MQKKYEGIVYAVNLYGHRQLYVNTLSAVTGFTYVTGRPTIELFLTLSRRKGSIVFITIEDTFYFYLLCGITRSMFGRKTVGMQFEHLKNQKKTLGRHLLKYLIRKALNKLRPLSTISIIPHEAFPLQRESSKASIHDPAFWDLTVNSRYENPDWGDVEANNIKRVCEEHETNILSLGTITERKGFEYFVDLMVMVRAKGLRVGFVAAGMVHHQMSEDLLDKFEGLGGVLIDRYLTESEVLYLQSKMDVFWACYPKHFDQSSGIAGRAFQLEKKVIVRKGSVIDGVLSSLRYNSIIVECSEKGLDALMTDLFCEKDRSQIEKLKTPYDLYSESVQILREYL